jgi:hypothetical protein
MGFVSNLRRAFEKPAFGLYNVRRLEANVE